MSIINEEIKEKLEELIQLLPDESLVEYQEADISAGIDHYLRITIKKGDVFVSAFEYKTNSPTKEFLEDIIEKLKESKKKLDKK